MFHILTVSRILWIFSIMSKLLKNVEQRSMSKADKISQQINELADRREAEMAEADHARRAAEKLASLIN